MVSFVTRDQLVVFDPHGTHLPGGLLGLRCNFVEKGFRDSHAAQAAPFVWEGASALPFCDADLRAPLDGTLFRLPLRTEQQAQRSAIAQHSFTDAEVGGLLQDLAQAAGSMLLFLKHVESIEIYERPAEGGAPRCVHRTAVGMPEGAAAASELRMLRCLSATSTQQPERSCYSYELALKREQPTVEESWLLHWSSGEELGEGEEESRGSAIAKGLGLSEWVAVAMPLSGRKGEREEPAGRAYCYLPLPISTGLRTHIHASFALSSNRRDLWMADDLSGGGALKAQWNAHLLGTALPHCMASMLELLPARISSMFRNDVKARAATIYAALPDLELVKSPFEQMATRTIREAARRDCAVLYDAGSREPWVRLSDAVFQDAEFAALFAGDSRVRQMMTTADEVRLVSPPQFVCASLQKAGVAVRTTSPKMVSSMLQKHTLSKLLTKAQAHTLLTYLLHDFRSRKDAFSNLISLNVAPMHALPSASSPSAGRASPVLATFQARTNSSNFLYLCPTFRLGDDESSPEVDGREMMPEFPWFLDPEASPEVLEALRSQQSLAQLNIVRLNLRALASNMQYVLPPAWRSRTSPIALDGASDTTAQEASPSKSRSWKTNNRKKRRDGGDDGSSHRETLGAREVLRRLELFWGFIDSCGERLDLSRTMQGWPVVMAARHAPAGGEPELFAMSVETAKSVSVLARDMYSQEELAVLDSAGVLFLTGAAERLAAQVQGSDKVAPALRAVARCFTPAHKELRALRLKNQSRAEQLADAGSAPQLEPEPEPELGPELGPEPELCASLRGLVLTWSGARGPVLQKKARRQRSFDSIPEGTLRALPIFETIGGEWVSAATTMGAVHVCCAPSRAWETLLRKHAVDVPCLSSEGDAGLLLPAAGLKGHEEEFLGECIAPWLLQEGADSPRAVCVAFIAGVERCSRVESVWKRKQERHPRSILQALADAPLVECVDGVRRPIEACMDPDDPDLRAVYGSSDSASLYPRTEYREAESLKVLRKAGMSSLGDGASFVQAARYIASRPPHPDTGEPTRETLAGARQLLSYLVQRSTKELRWSNTDFMQVAQEHWVPAQDWRKLLFPPDRCLSLQLPKAFASTSSERESLQDDSSDDDQQGEGGAAPLSVQEIRVRIEKIYRDKNPSKIHDVNRLLKKYKRKEAALYSSIVKKYEINERLYFAQHDTDDAPLETVVLAEDGADEEPSV